MLPQETTSAEVASEPFAVCALPTPEPVSDEHLHAAGEAMLALFPDGPIAERIRGGMEEARARAGWQFTDEMIRTQTQTVTLAKSGADILCSCPDWKFKRKLHTGMCRHICAVELVRMGQAHTGLAHQPVIADIGMATTLLRSILACAVASHESTHGITFTFAQNALALHTDTLDLTLRCTGYGSCTHQLAPQHLADLVAQLAATDDTEVMLQVTPTHMDVLGDTLEASLAVV